MYDVKAFSCFTNIPVPTCAYKLKNVQTCEITNKEGTKDEVRLNQPCALDMDILSNQIKNVLNTKSSVDIAQRQAAVLHKLELLQKLLEKKMNCFNFGALATISKTDTKVMKSLVEPLPDIIISANPNNIPYTLQALQNLWKDSIQLQLKFYKHSSLSDLCKEAQMFEQQTKLALTNPASQVMKVTLIWMQCDQIELISSSILHAPIYGEVNILRYLTRIGPYALRYENEMMSEVNQIDSFLDFCHQFVISKHNENNLKELSNSLAPYFKKDEFLYGKNISIADIYLLVAVKQKLKTNFNTKEMPVKFNAWRKRVVEILKL